MTGSEIKKKIIDWVSKYWSYCLSVPLLVVAAMAAVIAIARVLGWLTGASLSPVVAVVIPFVFGLLAVVGLSKEVGSPFKSRKSIWQSIFVAVLIYVFCDVYFYNVTKGTFDRAGEYQEFGDLLGCASDKIDHDTLVILYRLRLRARLANLPRADFEPIVMDVIRPIFEGDAPNKAERAKAAIETIEAAIPTPESPKSIDRTLPK